MERHLGCLVSTHLILVVDAEGLLAIAEWQRQLSLMGLAALIGDVGHADEIIEHRVFGLRQHHRHLHREVAVSVSHRLAVSHLFLVDRRPPPE